ncbi:MAG: hypothetical protein L3J74_11250, partial [Bacteroidales bacterium]|nr:hypothetical protein [Bacteroidales bacterium]
LLNNKLSLFLGCTHFPLIKNDFFDIADEFGISFSQLLNPNTEFANLIFDHVRKTVNKSNESVVANSIKLISRVQLKDSEIKGISSIIKKHSPETAKALLNYEYLPDLF